MKKYIFTILFLIIGIGIFNTAKADTIATSSYTIQGLRYGGTYDCPSQSPIGYWYELTNSYHCNEILSPYLWKYTASTTQTITEIEINAPYQDGYEATFRYDIYKAGQLDTIISTTTFTTLVEGGGNTTTTVTLSAPITLFSGDSLYFKPVKTSGSTGTWWGYLNQFFGTDTGGTNDFPPTLEILYPQNSTSTFIHNFTDFTL